jgi:hypothetical protein
LVGDQYAKRLVFAPALAFAHGDVRLVAHGSKTSRHPFPRNVPV